METFERPGSSLSIAHMCCQKLDVLFLYGRAFLNQLITNAIHKHTVDLLTTSHPSHYGIYWETMLSAIGRLSGN